MSFRFSAIKALARRTVHNTLSVASLYSYSTLFVDVELRVRWHHKIARIGDLEDGGYAEIVEGVNRLIFSRTELNEKGVVLHHGGRIVLIDPEFNNTVLILDHAEDSSGPEEEIWAVVSS